MYSTSEAGGNLEPAKSQLLEGVPPASPTLPPVSSTVESLEPQPAPEPAPAATPDQNRFTPIRQLHSPAATMAMSPHDASSVSHSLDSSFVDALLLQQKTMLEREDCIRESVKAEIEAQTRPPEAISEQRLAAVQARLDALHSSQLLSIGDTFAMEDIVADFLELRSTCGGELTLRYAQANEAGRKMLGLIGLSEGIVSDTGFARQVSRKYGQHVAPWGPMSQTQQQIYHPGQSSERHHQQQHDRYHQNHRQQPQQHGPPLQRHPPQLQQPPLLLPQQEYPSSSQLPLAPPPPTQLQEHVFPSVEDPATAALREELLGLRLMALQKKAAADGVDIDKVAGAVDSDAPKAQLIELIIGCHISAATEDTGRIQALRQELRGLKPMALQRRARGEGATEEQIEAAVDSDDPKAALIELLTSSGTFVSSSPRTTSDRPTDRKKPHFGAAAANARQAVPVQTFGETKHVMLSYNWSTQSEVKRVFDRLTCMGLRVWMDVEGGMGRDIYDSMAKGVANASVFVCFMNQKYQESENCMLEAKFAKQSGIEIIPVLMEGNGWKASKWLGLLTAGALWTPLYEEANFEENVRGLYGQLTKVLEDSTATDEDDANLSCSPLTLQSEAQEELARLRHDLVGSSEAATFVMAESTQPATIPAGVPSLPARFHPTSEITALTQLVLSTSVQDMTMSRVGFHGMGGIGKTVTKAAIVRNEGVRLHFDAIVWLPIGQTPVVAKLQNLCYMQCVGKELSSELSLEERKQALQQAMKGKRVLMCLDDLWEEQHERELNFADVGAGSKVLMSTRMKGLLAGGHQVEVGLPSVEDSIQMMLSVADANGGVSCANTPVGVKEIVELCGRLPLALGIAGRLAANLGLVGMQDWSGMIDVLKEELRESHSGGTEEGMIRASLRGLKGSAKEQASVKSLLKLFAIVPEDTHCPLEVLLLMFRSTTPESDFATIMHIRKWLRILIDRSLVLGTVDRPSVHDLVLDFAVAQHSSEELCAKHHRVVEAFREARPADWYGRRAFTRLRRADSAMASYICDEITHHIAAALKHDDRASMASEWLSDVPQDIIVESVGQVVGIDRLSAMATAADQAEDWWLSARYWNVVACVTRLLSGNAGLQDATTKGASAIQLMSASTRWMLPEVTLQRDEIHLAQFVASAQLMNIPFLMTYQRAIEDLRKSEVAVRDPISMIIIDFTLDVVAKCFIPDTPGVAAGCGRMISRLHQTYRSHPDPVVRYSCLFMSFNTTWLLDAMTTSSSFVWDEMFGKNGALILEAAETYNYEAIHDYLCANMNGDWFQAQSMPTIAMALHYADIPKTVEVFDATVRTNVMSSRLTGAGEDIQMIGLFTGCYFCNALVHSVGLRECYRAAAEQSESMALTWALADPTMDKMTAPSVRKRGCTDRGETDFYALSAEQLIYLCKYSYVLVARQPGVSAEEVIASLPTVEEIVGAVVTLATCSPYHAAFGLLCNLFYIIAEVCAKFGRSDLALNYATVGLESDVAEGGTTLPCCRVLLLSTQGRAYAALGRMPEATAALEEAAELGQRSGWLLYAAYALRDLKLGVLDQSGQGEQGSRRLGAALRQLTGPAEALTPLLKGLDACTLIAMEPPT